MTLPAPKLDDRRFQDLVDEAKRRVQERCPEWTNHNVSDPGVTLIETFAWMTDQLLYRLNRVPDLNYVKFLELLGVTLQPPTAATVDLTFWLSKAQENVLEIPAMAQVSTVRNGSGQQVTFATTAPLPIVPCSIAWLASVDHLGNVRDRRDAGDDDTEFVCFGDPESLSRPDVPPPPPRPGDAFLVGLHEAVPSCAVKIHLDCKKGEGGGISDTDPPLAWDASVGEDRGTVHLWNTATREELDRFTDHGVARVAYVAFSPDGHRLASVGDDGTVRLRDIHDPRKPWSLAEDPGIVRGVAFSPDGKMLATAGTDGALRLWDVGSREAIPPVLDQGVHPLACVAFSPDGLMLASGANDGTVRLYTFDQTRKRYSLHKASEPAYTLGGYSFALKPGAPAGIEIEVGVQFDDPADVFSLKIVPDQGAPEAFEVSTRKDSETNVVHTVNNESRLIQAQQIGGELELRPKTGRYDLHDNPVRGVAFSTDGETLASAGHDGTVRLWRAETLEPLGAFVYHRGRPVRCVAFRPDGATQMSVTDRLATTTLATGGDDGNVRLWDLGNVGTLNGTASGKDLETGASGGAKHGNATRPEAREDGLEAVPRPRILVGSERGGVHGVAFSADGEKLATVGADWTARLWNVDAHEQFGRPLSDRCPVYGVAFVRSGGKDILATAGWDGGWEPCEIASDTTKGLNEHADVVLHVPRTHKPVVFDEKPAGWLRCRVRAHENDQTPYDQSPKIDGKYEAETIGGTVLATNAEIVVGEVLGVSDGTASQRFLVDRRPVVPMPWGEDRVLEVQNDEGTEEWNEVSSFADSGENSRHFMLDPVQGEVVLGPAVRVSKMPVPRKISVLVGAGDDPIYAAGVAAELQRFPDVRVVFDSGEADVTVVIDRLDEGGMRDTAGDTWRAESVGERIQRLRSNRGLRPRDLDGLAESEAQKIERGVREPSDGELRNIAAALEVTSEYLERARRGGGRGGLVLLATKKAYEASGLAEAVAHGDYRFVDRDEATGQAIVTQVRAAAGSDPAAAAPPAHGSEIRHHGHVPAEGAVLTVRKYLTGGGSQGNVSERSLTVLREPIANVASVENRRAAVGGVDVEDIENAKLRGPITLRTGDRAVTPEDYEQLAREAAPELARVECIPATLSGEEQAGKARVLVVPTVDSYGGRIRFEDLVPGVELVNRITTHLESRRVVGVRVEVGPPDFRGFTIVAKLVALPAFDDEDVKNRALDGLYRAFSPISGGRDGKGWEFGRDVLETDVRTVLGSIRGVDRIEDCKLFNASPETGVRTLADSEPGEPSQIVPVSRHATVFSYRHYVLVAKGDR